MKVQVTPKPGPSYPTLLTSALAADSAPNIFGMGAGGNYNTIAQAGHLHDLTGKINIGALLPSATAFMYIGNKVYALAAAGRVHDRHLLLEAHVCQVQAGHPADLERIYRAVQDDSEQEHVPGAGMPSQDGIIPTFFWTGFMTTIHGPQA